MRVTRMTSLIALVAMSATLVVANRSQAAFMVDAHTSGTGHANFSYGGDTTSASVSTTESRAVGITATDSIYGGNGVTAGDTYIFSYTPGANADNTSFNNGDVLGSIDGFAGPGHVATGAAGGASGTYNVYFTTPETTSISGGNSNFTITSDGAPILLSLNLNNGGTGVDTNPGVGFAGGANNTWYLLGQVELTAGNTYTVTQAASSNSFVSQRAQAVMWEFVPDAIPEPASFVLAAVGLAGVGIAARRRSA